MGRHRHVCECVFEGGARLGYNWVRLQWDVIGVDEMRWDEGAWYDAAKIFFRASPILKISLFIWAWIGGVNAPLYRIAPVYSGSPRARTCGRHVSRLHPDSPYRKPPVRSHLWGRPHQRG